MLFWVMLAVSVYIFIWVPQISNIWRQLPPWGGWWVGYVVFLVPLLLFYLGSVLVVLDSPLRSAPSRPDGEPGIVRRALWLLFCAAPDAAAGWLSWLTAKPHEAGSGQTWWERAWNWVAKRVEPTRRWVAQFLGGRRGGTVVLVLGLMALGSGAVSDSSALYPLVGAFCRGLGLILVGIGLWLLAGRDQQQAAQTNARLSGREALLWVVGLVVGLAALGAGVAWSGSDSYRLLGAVCRALGATLAGVALSLLVSEVGRWGVVLTVGVVLLVAVLAWDDLALSPWAGPLCWGLGVLLAGVGVGLLAWGPWPRPDGKPAKWRSYAGRLLSWLFVTAWVGELLWSFAYPDWLWGIFSYRLYTIWAVLQGLTFLVLLGLLTDRLRKLYRPWPVRLVAGALLVFGFGAFTHWEALSPNEAERHLTGDQAAVAREMDRLAAAAPTGAAKARAGRWFQQFQDRIGSIPEGEGPVVLVAASGGGSRAAIFTALTLEALRRTPLDPEPGPPALARTVALLGSPQGQGPLLTAATLVPGSAKSLLVPGHRRRTWADNVVLISSVSGGSLATAWYVHRLSSDSQAPLPVGLRDADPLTDLRNTTRAELVSHLATLAGRELADYPALLAERGAAAPRSADEEVAARLRQLGALTDEGKSGLLAEREKMYQKLVRQRDQLRQKRGAELMASEAPLHNTDADDLFFDALVQLIARLQSDALAQQLEGQAVGAGPLPGAGAAKGWVLQSKAFDEMCLDFMAPLMRGALSPTLDRGDALARFWTHRFGWYNATNFNGYGGPVNQPNYQPYQPLVLFNTCDVGLGSRLVVGFPAVPDDFWKAASDDRRATSARPRPINELVPNFRVSLARAVRLSSNFPFGFRVSGVEMGQKGDHGARQWIHMLDGGVIDNTGLDTIYELFKALEWHAQSGTSPYRDRAHAILEGLRKRGVVLLEIDSGAKPSQATPYRLDPRGGPREPLQALDNASYTNAEVVKKFYVNGARQILRCDLQGLRELGPEVSDSLAVFTNKLADTAPVYLVFQCNHYLPGQNVQDPEVMTAWALGPNDKAQIVQRFLIELEVWDQHRRDAYRDVQRGLAKCTFWGPRARKKALLDLIPFLLQQYAQLERDALARTGPKELRERNDRLKARLARVQAEVRLADDPDVSRAWEGLQRQAKRAELQVAAAGLPPVPRPRWVELTLPEAAAALVEAGGAMIDVAQARKAQRDFNLLLGKELSAQPGAARDPQRKYDLSATRTKMLLESPPPR
jgi:hypothetical protein